MVPAGSVGMKLLELTAKKLVVESDDPAFARALLACALASAGVAIVMFITETRAWRARKAFKA